MYSTARTLRSPDFELGSPDFGRITTTVGGPRVMQFRAKFKF